MTIIIAVRSILLVIAVICFVLAAIGVPARAAWVPLGLALFAASFLAV